MKDLHEILLNKLNKTIKGDIVSKKFNGIEGYKPDIINRDIEYELELVGRPIDLLRFRNKWKKKRFDKRKCSKRVLVIAINPKYTQYFDKIYIFNEKINNLSCSSE